MAHRGGKTLPRSLPFPLKWDEGDEQFTLKRCRFGKGIAIFNLVNEVMKSCNQAPGKFQLDPLILSPCIK
jgi:hypothetical protein